MREDEFGGENKMSLWEGRAVIAVVVTVTVFLCLLTTVEFVSLKTEWNVPALAMFIGDSDSILFEKLRADEEELEVSRENVAQEPVKEQLVEQGAESKLEPTTEVEPIPVQEQTSTSVVEATTENGQDSSTEKVTTAEEEFPYYLKINRQQNVVTAYEKDENGEYTVPVRAILCSTGLYNATPTGIFSLSNKYVWRELNGGVYGQYASRITGGVLFHSVPYASKNKATLYTDKYNKLGQQASMGCVRLTVEDAKWIYDNCPSGTKVEIYDSDDPGPLGKPVTLKIDKDNVNKGWDPTDPDERNPWHAWSEDN